MAERLSISWPEQLELLLELLRRDGFRIGVPETVRLHQLLLALVERQVPLASAERLASLLGPVLCRSASEQEAFRRHVQEWWPGPVVLEPSPQPAVEAAASPSALAQALVAVEHRRRRALRWLPVAPLALAATVGLVAAGVVGDQQLQRRPEPRLPLRSGPVPAAQPSNAAVTQAQPAPPPKPASPEPAAQPSLLPGREQALLLLPSELALLTLLGALLSWAGVQGAVRGWWWQQARLVLQRLPLRGDPQLHRIALEVIEPDLVALPELHRIGRALNLWQRLPSADLDAAATVQASLRQGGWLSLRYRERRERLSYLFFLDQDSLADQQTRYLRTWLERLRQEGVLAEWVCFQRQPLLCRGRSGQGPLRRLSELAALHPDAVAVVVADGERFFSPVDGTPLPWIEALAAWPQRLALTPRPQARWGAAERELERFLPVLPVSVEGLLGLGRLLQGAPVGPLPAEAQLAPAPEPPLLRGSSAPWLDRTPPTAELVRDLLAQLRAHLGPEGFLWLAACAVFPELHWTITAYLGERLRNGAGEPLLSRCPLLRLARLPWLRHGFMPDWLRLPLIVALDDGQQTAVRQALGQLLLSAAAGDEVGRAQLQVATGLRQRLLPPLLEQLRRRSSPTSPLRDQLFLRFLQNRPLLAADAPESLRGLLPPQPPAARLRSALAGLNPRALAASALVLLVLGGLGLVAVRQVQLAWMDQLLRTPAGGTSGAQASLRLQRAITALGLSRSSLMRLGPEPDLRRVEGVLAEGASQALELVVLEGHKGWVLSVGWSPDGARVASGGDDGTVRLWDTASGRELAVLEGHRGRVWSVAWSPEGARVASGGEDGTVRLWHTESGRELAVLEGHKGVVVNVGWSPGGARVASGGVDGTVRMWDTASGRELAVLEGHGGWVWSVGWSPDHSRVASGGGDGTVRLRAVPQPRQGPLGVSGAPQPWQRTLPIACRQLAIHPNLNGLPWLNSARATCRHFTGLPLPPPAAGLAASFRPWLLPAGAGLGAAVGFGAAGLALAQRRRLRRKEPLGPPPSSPPATPALRLRPLTVVSAQLHRRGGQWQVEQREVTVQSFEEQLANGLNLRMIQIPAGRCVMGSPDDQPDRSSDEGPQHEVTLQEFFMAQTPITQAQWRAVARWQARAGERWGRKLNPAPSRFHKDSGSDQRPVENVNWYDALEFCSRLSQRTGRVFTLPSEAQWEYACRAGSTTPFHVGPMLTPELANYSHSQTTPVGLFPANAWGLHDMHGNVCEWCLDQWHGSYEGAPSDGSAWVDLMGDGNTTGTRKEHMQKGLLRGGSWYDSPRSCRSAFRFCNAPAYISNDVGFRVVCLPQGRSLDPGC